MKDATGGDRVRVLIAGNIYTKRALVRRFLEDDGFSVVAEALTRTELRTALGTSEPDAIVLDAELLQDGGAGLAMIRRKAPGAKIVVFTTGPGEEPKGADGYLRKGVNLATLTALLGRLCSEQAVVLGSSGLGVVEASEPATSAGAIAFIPQPEGMEPRSHSAALRAGAVGIAAVIVIVLASTLFSSGPSPLAVPTGNPSANLSGNPTASPSPGHSQTALELAQSDLLQLRDALSSGSYLTARGLAESFMNDRSVALSEGFSIAALDLRIQSLLSPLMESIAPRVIPFLRNILGDLLPPVPVEGGGGGGGGGGGTTTTDGGGTSTGGTTGGGGTGGGGTGDGGNQGGGGGGSEGGGGGGGGGNEGGGGGGGGGNEGGGGGGGEGHGFPGKGKHLGWVHKPPHGGWHGHKPE